MSLAPMAPATPAAGAAPGAVRRLSAADLLTLANAGAGAASLALALAGRGGVAAAVALLVACCLLDVADGPLARRLGASSHGVTLDVTADLVAFGIAPAAWLARDAAARGAGWGSAAVVAAAACFVAAAAFRLARHARGARGAAPGPAARSGAGAFAGLPMPAAGAAAVALLALHPGAALAAAGLLAMAALMASTLPWPGPSWRLAPVLAAAAVAGAVGAAGAIPLRGVAAAWLLLVAAGAVGTAVRGTPGRRR